MRPSHCILTRQFGNPNASVRMREREIHFPLFVQYSTFTSQSMLFSSLFLIHLAASSNNKPNNSHLLLTNSQDLLNFYSVPVIISVISKVDKQPPFHNTTPQTSEKTSDNDKKKTISTYLFDQTDNLRTMNVQNAIQNSNRGGTKKGKIENAMSDSANHIPPIRQS